MEYCDQGDLYHKINAQKGVLMAESRQVAEEFSHTVIHKRKANVKSVVPGSPVPLGTPAGSASKRPSVALSPKPNQPVAIKKTKPTECGALRNGKRPTTADSEANSVTSSVQSNAGLDIKRRNEEALAELNRKRQKEIMDKQKLVDKNESVAQNYKPSGPFVCHAVPVNAPIPAAVSRPSCALVVADAYAKYRAELDRMKHEAELRAQAFVHNEPSCKQNGKPIFMAAKPGVENCGPLKQPVLEVLEPKIAPAIERRPLHLQQQNNCLNLKPKDQGKQTFLPGFFPAPVPGLGAARRAQLVEEFLMVRREAARNKARGGGYLMGVAAALGASPRYAEYDRGPNNLEVCQPLCLLQVARQLYTEGVLDDMLGCSPINNITLLEQLSVLEERKRKVEEVKNQAESRAKMLQDHLEQRRRQICASEIEKETGLCSNNQTEDSYEKCGSNQENANKESSVKSSVQPPVAPSISMVLKILEPPSPHVSPVPPTSFQKASPRQACLSNSIQQTEQGPQKKQPSTKAEETLEPNSMHVDDSDSISTSADSILLQKGIDIRKTKRNILRRLNARSADSRRHWNWQYDPPSQAKCGADDQSSCNLIPQSGIEPNANNSPTDIKPAAISSLAETKRPDGAGATCLDPNPRAHWANQGTTIVRKLSEATITPAICEGTRKVGGIAFEAELDLSASENPLTLAPRLNKEPSKCAWLSPAEQVGSNQAHPGNDMTPGPSGPGGPNVNLSSSSIPSTNSSPSRTLIPNCKEVVEKPTLVKMDTYNVEIPQVVKPASSSTHVCLFQKVDFLDDTIYKNATLSRTSDASACEVHDLEPVPAQLQNENGGHTMGQEQAEPVQSTGSLPELSQLIGELKQRLLSDSSIDHPKKDDGALNNMPSGYTEEVTRVLSSAQEVPENVNQSALDRNTYKLIHSDEGSIIQQTNAQTEWQFRNPTVQSSAVFSSNLTATAVGKEPIFAPRLLCSSKRACWSTESISICGTDTYQIPDKESWLRVPDCGSLSRRFASVDSQLGISYCGSSTRRTADVSETVKISAYEHQHQLGEVRVSVDDLRDESEEFTDNEHATDDEFSEELEEDSEEEHQAKDHRSVQKNRLARLTEVDEEFGVSDYDCDSDIDEDTVEEYEDGDRQKDERRRNSPESNCFDEEENENANMSSDTRFLRLERMRADLERELGIEKLLRAYNIIQALQEDEDEDITASEKAVSNVLGETKAAAYYDRILQLVLADGAYMDACISRSASFISDD
ncbi:serine/threonine-protein kinase Nek1 [Clonorchis sinensis]|uniref:non-specific serine/threonine protein kinase n=1 Tax=Clonorchis sinensis TaxID=79923 RepID=G7YN69_CLOSI|nr:serine/threonine-protein kinase Nek1 [Clonorchis sinensis]